MFPEELSPGEIVDDDSFDDPKKHEVASPGSSLSFSPSSRTAGGTGSALGTLMAEMDEEEGDEEDEDDILSPLPCTATPPTFHHSQQEEKRENHANSLKSDMSPPGGAGGTHKGKHRRSSSSTTGKPEKKSSAKTEKKSKEPAKKDGGDLVGGGGVVEKTDHKSLSSGTSGCVEENPCDLKGHKAPNGEHLSVLLELQKKLVTMQDRGLLQQVVNVIEETGLYKIGDSTFDFDLCMLDSPTVQKLKAFLDSAT